MWNIWNSREKSENSNIEVENSENGKEFNMNVKETEGKGLMNDHTVGDTLKKGISSLTLTKDSPEIQSSRVKKNGAIIGEDKDSVRKTPESEVEIELHSECMRKIHNSLCNLIGIMQDFNNAQVNEKTYRNMGSCICDNRVYVNLGSMGDIKCARFDPGNDNSGSSEQESSSLSTYTAKCSFGNALSPKQVYDFLVNVENKMLYDTTCSESSSIYNLGNYSMFKQCYRGMMGVQGREFLLIGSNYALSEDFYALVATSTSETRNILNNEEIAVKDSYVRGEIKYVGYIVRKYKGETELFFAQKMDLGGTVPLMLQRIVLSTQLQSLNTLKKHLLDNKDIYFSKCCDSETSEEK